jgi:hypothetical protein
MKVPVEGNPGLYRDSKSGAILNCSDMEFEKYLELKELKLKESNELKKIKSQVEEIDQLKSDVTQIKDILQVILQKLDTNS